MILSNVHIHNALDERSLILDPEPSPRFPSPDGKIECPYNTTSVDLRLGEEILIPKEDRPFNIDFSVRGRVHRGGFRTRRATAHVPSPPRPRWTGNLSVERPKDLALVSTCRPGMRRSRADPP